LGPVLYMGTACTSKFSIVVDCPLASTVVAANTVLFKASSAAATSAGPTSFVPSLSQG
jgi:hypothetical protein